MVGFGWCLMTVVLVVVMTARPETSMEVWTLSAMGLVVVFTAIPWMVGRINGDGDLDNYPHACRKTQWTTKTRFGENHHMIWCESPMCHAVSHCVLLVVLCHCCLSLCMDFWLQQEGEPPCVTSYCVSLYECVQLCYFCDVMLQVCSASKHDRIASFFSVGIG